MQPRFQFAPSTPVADLPEADFPIVRGRFTEAQLDCETNGVSWARGARPVGWALGLPDGTDRYFAFGHASGNNCTREQFYRWATAELPGVHIDNHSIKFDMHMSRVDGVDLRALGCTFSDVAHSAALLDDHRSDFGLDALGQTYLGMGKIDMGPKSDLADLPAGMVGPYACRDTKLVRELRKVMDPQLQAEGLLKVQAIENGVLPVAVEMEANGMPIDVDRLERWRLLAQRLTWALQMRLNAGAGFQCNTRSPQDLQRLFEKEGAAIGVTLRGGRSFTAPIVAEAALHSPLIRLAQQIRTMEDLRSRYLDKYTQDHVNGVLYPNLWQLMTDEGGTVSGRFSCTRPNMQQVLGADKHLRKYGQLLDLMLVLLGKNVVAEGDDFLIKRLFRPERGVWASCDAKQIEYRIFAHYAGKRISGIYAKPPAQRLVGGKMAWVEGPEADYHSIVSEMILPYRPEITRTEVKTANFLKIFGGGPGALARNLGIEYDAAESIAAVYDEAFPEAAELGREATNVAERRGYVRTYDGRRGRFPYVWVMTDNGRRKERDRTHKALNAVIQGTAADINKKKLIEVYREKERLGFTMRLTVHDSMEGDLEDRSMLPALVEVLDRQTTPLQTPILWEGKAGTSWADAK